VHREGSWVLVDDAHQEYIDTDRLQNYTPNIVLYSVAPDVPQPAPKPQQSTPSAMAHTSSHPTPSKPAATHTPISAAAFGIRPAGGEFMQCSGLQICNCGAGMLYWAPASSLERIIFDAPESCRLDACRCV